MIEIDLSGFASFREIVALLKQTITPSDLMQGKFQDQVKVHMINMFDQALKDGGGLQEGQSAVIRGQTWNGWATRTVEKYGESVTESTRYYYRKKRRGESTVQNFDKALKVLEKKVNDRKLSAKVKIGLRRLMHEMRKARVAARSTYRGTIGATKEARKNIGTVRAGRARDQQRIADRSFELVWRRREGSMMYSAGSKLMQASGALRQMLGVDIQASVIGFGRGDSVLELRPGTSIDYFDYQNSMRPIFVFDPPEDEPKFGSFLEDAIAEALAKAGGS